jgi:hypothetical protein
MISSEFTTALAKDLMSDTRGFHPNSTLRYSDPADFTRLERLFRVWSPTIEGKPSLINSPTAVDIEKAGLVGSDLAMAVVPKPFKALSVDC